MKSEHLLVIPKKQYKDFLTLLKTYNLTLAIKGKKISGGNVFQVNLVGKQSDFDFVKRWLDGEVKTAPKNSPSNYWEKYAFYSERQIKWARNFVICLLVTFILIYVPIIIFLWKYIHFFGIFLSLFLMLIGFRLETNQNIQEYKELLKIKRKEGYTIQTILQFQEYKKSKQ